MLPNPNIHYRRITAIKWIRKNEAVAAHVVFDPPLVCASGQQFGFIAQQKEIIVVAEIYEGRAEPFFRRTFDPPLVLNKGDNLSLAFQLGDV